MTLILSVVTQEFVAQVSDRRLTSVPGGKIVEEASNKAIFFCGQSAIAYTGMAKLEGVPTDEWVLNQLGSATSLWAGLEALKERATRAMRGMDCPSSLLRSAGR